MGVIVTDCEERIGFNVSRSLGKAGVNVTPCSKTRLAAAFYSRFCKNGFIYFPPEKNFKLFLRDIIKISEKKSGYTFIPVSDYSLLGVLTIRKKLEKSIKLPLASTQSIEVALDKGKTLSLVKDLSIPYPETFFPKNLSDVRRISKRLKYPVIVKPRKSKVVVGNRVLSYRVKVAYNEKDLIRNFKMLHVPKNPPLIQSVVKGVGYGFFALFNRGEIRAFFIHRRIREFPVGMGASTLRESAYDARVKRFGKRILEELNWHGVAMVEFKMDEKGKKPKLMEINPRFWGSLRLAIEAGVDFPLLLYRMITEGDVERVMKYKLGVRCRWFVGDMLHLLSVLSGKYEKNLITRGKFETLINFLKPTGTFYDILSLDDPLPGVVNLIYSISRGLRR